MRGGFRTLKQPKAALNQLSVIKSLLERCLSVLRVLNFPQWSAHCTLRHTVVTRDTPGTAHDTVLHRVTPWHERAWCHTVGTHGIVGEKTTYMTLYISTQNYLPILWQWSDRSDSSSPTHTGERTLLRAALESDAPSRTLPHELLLLHQSDTTTRCRGRVSIIVLRGGKHRKTLAKGLDSQCHVGAWSCFRLPSVNVRPLPAPLGTLGES